MLDQFDVPLNRVNFCCKNYATGYPFQTKIMWLGFMIGKKLSDRVSYGKGIRQCFYNVFIMFTLSLRRDICLRKGIPLAHILCHRVQGMKTSSIPPFSSLGKYAPWLDLTVDFENEVSPRGAKRTTSLNEISQGPTTEQPGSGTSVCLHTNLRIINGYLPRSWSTWHCYA